MMRRFAALVLCLMFCCTMIPAALADEPSGVEDGVLTVAMECNYAPYNWSQGDDSNGAVPIRDSREYANGYDVMMAKKLCEANGWQLEIVRLDWDSLVPAVQAGVVDAVIAGQSMTASRAEMVDFAGPYLCQHRVPGQAGHAPGGCQGYLGAFGLLHLAAGHHLV